MSSTPRRRSSSGIWMTLIGALVVLVVAAGSAVAGWWDPVASSQRLLGGLYPVSAATAQADEIRSLYDIVFVIAAAIFLLVEGLIIWTVVRYRRRPGDDELPPQIHGHFGAEIVWTVVPTILVAFLFVISWQTLNTVDAVSAQPDIRIRADAAQFQWSFDYLDGTGDSVLFSQIIPTGADGGLFLPVGRSVHVSLHSDDVIHAFYVPRFLFKRDVVPGVENVFEFTINAADVGATFSGQCAELCGNGHRAMVFDVHALSQSDYETWRAGMIEKANATPTPPPSGPVGETVDLTAKGVKFDKTELTVTSGASFTVHFVNDDAAIPHDLSIRKPDGADIFKGDSFPGVETRDYTVPALDPGTYQFYCSIHPTAMFGTLTAE